MEEKTMAFGDCFTFFLVFLSFCFLTIGWPHDRPHIVVDIRNDLPNDTPDQLELSCQGSWFYLKLGDHYNRTLTPDQDLECNAVWSRWFTTWDAYEARRYKGHDTIYWSVKKDGFYRSWDGSNSKLVEYWYTE